MTTYTYVNGQMIEVPDTVVDEDTDIREPISSTLIIRPGVTVTSFAPINGTVRIMSRGRLEARGPVSGTVRIDTDAHGDFYHHANGTLHVASGAVAHLHPESVALGTLHIDGHLINDGVRGVQVKGIGEIEDREGSSVRPPDRTLADGTIVYEG